MLARHATGRILTLASRLLLVFVSQTAMRHTLRATTHKKPATCCGDSMSISSLLIALTVSGQMSCVPTCHSTNKKVPELPVAVHAQQVLRRLAAGTQLAPEEGGRKATRISRLL